MAPRRFSASSAAQFISCPGSHDLERSIPGFEYPVVDEDAGAKGKGTQLHEWLAGAGQLSAKDMAATAEALAYVAQVKSGRRFKTLVEEKVQVEWLDAEAYTTVDLVFYVQDELHILDWKTGQIPVSPINNAQLMFYALCFTHLAPKAAGVWLHIVQPWCDNTARWWCSSQELLDFQVLAQVTEKKILAGDTTLGPSDHCGFCPANPITRGDRGNRFCPAMRELLYPYAVDEDEILGM